MVDNCIVGKTIPSDYCSIFHIRMISVPKGNGASIHSLIHSFTWRFHSVRGLASDEMPDFVFVVFIHPLITRSLTSSVSVS